MSVEKVSFGSRWQDETGILETADPGSELEAHLDNCASEWVKSFVITSKSLKCTARANRSERSNCPILLTVIGQG